MPCYRVKVDFDLFEGSTSLTMIHSNRLLGLTLIVAFLLTLCLAKGANEPLVIRVRSFQTRVLH